MEYPKTYFAADHNEHLINLIDITMVRLGQWPSSEWSASGHHIVWHSSGKCESIEVALRQLIDNVAAWVIENNTLKRVSTD